MNERAFAALRRALAGPPGAHVDDDTLAQIVTAELAGEEVEERFAAALAHVELCEQCIEAYAELSEMMGDALSAMSAAAAAIPPEEVYAELLTQQLARAGVAPEQAQPLAQQVAAALPMLPHSPPRTADFGEQLARAALAHASPADAAAEGAQHLLPALAQALQQTASALSLFLQGKAAAIWRRGLAAQSAMSAGWNQLHFTLLPPRTATTLDHRGGDAERWELFHVRLGQPLPLTVRGRAERLSLLTCRIVVRADRPGQQDASGRLVRFTVGSQQFTAETDAAGEVRFEPLPIAALSAFWIAVAED